MCRLFSRERDMLPKWHGQMMVRWYSKKRDKLHWWSDTGQIDSSVERLTLRGGLIMVKWFSHEGDMLLKWSDAGQMIS